MQLATECLASATGLPARRRGPLRLGPQAALHPAPHSAGLILYTKGALEALLPLCTPGADRRRKSRPLDAELHKELLARAGGHGGEGLRVLAVAHRTVPEGATMTAWRRT